MPARRNTRHYHIEAGTDLAELKGLDIHPLPSPRTAERVLQRHGLTTPRERLPRLLPRQGYPATQEPAPPAPESPTPPPIKLKRYFCDE